MTLETSRNTLNADVDVVVVVDIVVANSRNITTISSICERDVPAATVACSSRSMSNADVEEVCDADIAVSSRRTDNTDTDVDVVVAMVATSSRSITTINSICDNAVVVAIVVLNSNVAAPNPR